MKSEQIERACDSIAKFFADEQKLEHCIDGISVVGGGNFSLQTFNVRFKDKTIEVVKNSRVTKISVHPGSVIFLAERNGNCITHKIMDAELGRTDGLHFLVAIGLIAEGKSLIKSLGVLES